MISTHPGSPGCVKALQTDSDTLHRSHSMIVLCATLLTPHLRSIFFTGPFWGYILTLGKVNTTSLPSPTSIEGMFGHKKTRFMTKLTYDIQSLVIPMNAFLAVMSFWSHTLTLFNHFRPILDTSRSPKLLSLYLEQH